MAQDTLAVLSSPEFPQVFSQAITHIFTRVRRFPDAPIYCQNELPEYGGELCARIAVVSSLETEQQLCMGCFREVSR
jgi:hypothetical protein